TMSRALFSLTVRPRPTINPPGSGSVRRAPGPQASNLSRRHERTKTRKGGRSRAVRSSSILLLFRAFVLSCLRDKATYDDTARLTLAALARLLMGAASKGQTDPGRMFVVGRVLDSQGRPVPGATIGASVHRKLLFASIGSEDILPAPVGQAASDASGAFRLDAPRTSSSRHAEFGLTAVAPGYGVGWASLDPHHDQP